MKDLAGFISTLSGIDMTTDPVLVRQRSRDMTAAYSPVLRREIRERSADLIVHPRDRNDVIRVAQAAARHAMPLIARGAGTATFGQGIPLKGGAIIEMTSLDQIIWRKGPVLRAEPGVRLIDIDSAARAEGWELRMHPSTKRASTLGGFVAGGHAGVGSCTYGILRDRGNLIGLEVISVEEDPRILELRGEDVNLVHHAYGANGLITAIELPLAPAWQWAEAIVIFKDFMQAVAFGRALALSDGIVTKLISIAGAPLGSMMRPLSPLVRPDESMVLCMTAAPFEESFRTLIAASDGVLGSFCKEDAGSYGAPIYEFAWGHARLQINKTDRSIVGGNAMFPVDEHVDVVSRSYRRFRELGAMHLEVKRVKGRLIMQGSPLFPFVDESHLNSVLDGMEQDGAVVANNHTFHIRGGGLRPIELPDLEFKRAMDPYGLLNPGKMETTTSATEVIPA